MSHLLVHTVCNENEKALQGRKDSHQHQGYISHNRHPRNKRINKSKKLSIRKQKNRRELRTQDRPIVTKMEMRTRSSLEFSFRSVSGAFDRVKWISEATKKNRTTFVQTKMKPGRKKVANEISLERI